MSYIKAVLQFFWTFDWQTETDPYLQLSHLSFCCTCMECPVGLRGNLKVSLKDGSLSCRQTLVFFLMILF